MHVWRRATNTTYLHRSKADLLPMSDMDVIKELSVMLPMTMTRLLRLNLLIRLAIGGNFLLKAVIFRLETHRSLGLEL